MPILVFLGLSVLDLRPMYAPDRRQTDVRHASSLNASALWGRRHNNISVMILLCYNSTFSCISVSIMLRLIMPPPVGGGIK